MKNTYTFGKPASVELELYYCNKYEAAEEQLENAKRWTYNNVTHWDIVSGLEAQYIEKECGGDPECLDPCGEYLILHFGDGDTATFRNSCCDMFRVH